MRALIAVLAIVAGVAVCQGRTITVDNDGPADFSTIQAAIDDSNDGDTVLVADGTYTGDGNRDIDFHGKAITVKSENGPETCIIDCNASEYDEHRGFYFQSGEDANSAIIGFTITNGYSPRECLTRPPWPCSWLGGGIRCKGTNPTISQCWITGNRADHGGGIHSDDGSPIVTHCTISGNYAWGVGGGMRLDGGSPRISYCTFSDNTAWVGGGGIYTSDTNLVATNCTFVGNSAVGDGGALYEHNSSPDVRNCIFTENTAGGDGGAVHAWSGSEPVITNCVFTGNRAMRSGGGIASKGHSDPVLTNCILRANKASKGNAISVLEYVGSVTYRSEITVNYSDVEGGYDSAYVEEGCRVNWHEGNVDADPCFADPGYWTDPCGTASEWWDDVWIDGDYHVKSQAGRWDAKEGRWMKDEVTSPCVDAGDPMSLIGLEPFPNGGVINIGAYGGTIEASKSWFAKAVCGTIVAGDVNGDCNVDFLDFRLMASHWLEDNTPVNSNSIVKDGIEYYMLTDKAVYDLGEGVEMLYRVTNLTDEDVEFLFWYSVEWNFWVNNGGENIWTAVTGWWAYINTLELRPGQAKEYLYTWNMEDSEGTLVAPGQYDVTGGFDARMDEFGDYDFSKVVVTVKIEP